MENSSYSSFCCPICRRTLTAVDRRLTCPMGHSYDLSKAGYVNLLPPGGAHGDNKEMVGARAGFLRGGYYAPFREAIVGALREQSPRSLLDVGCGECYYTAEMKRALPECRICGVDISKDALKLGARRMKGGAELAVASAYSLPVPEASFEALTLIFSPFSREECLRALCPGGRFYMAVPGRRHLWELKQLLYERPYENAPALPEIPGFDFLDEKYVEFRMRPEGQALFDLFAMTPYFYRTPAEGRARLKECESLEITASFHIFSYEKPV